ncbi:hypothetical protein Tco_0817868 [Tanacetum coccineum]
MSTSNQQTLADSGANDRPPMLEKGNYIPWESRLRRVLDNKLEDGERITISYDVLYDSLVQFEPHVLASKPKKSAKIVDYEDEYQGELQGDSQEGKLTTTMMMVELTYKSRMQVMVATIIRMQGDITRIKHLMQELGMMKEIKLFSVFHELNQLRERQMFSVITAIKKGHYARDYHKPRVRDAKYVREQMLLGVKDEAGSNLNNEENDFMLDTSYGEETMEELTAVVMLMAQIQLAYGNAETVLSYDANAVSEVNASSKVHEQVSHVKRKTIIQTSDDDQIDSNIIFDDPYVEHNGGTSDHDSNDHEIQMQAYNVKKEAENQKRLNNELKKQKMLLQKELETCKFYKTDVIPMSASLSKNLKELKEELIEENRVLKNTNAKSSTAHVWKMSRSASIDSNKRETKNSNVCQSNASVLSTKTVNAVNDGLNIVCASCGKDVFLLSHEKCVARYALSRSSSVKRALFTTPIAAKSKNLGATSVVVKSRLSVAKTPTATNRVSSVLPLSPDSSQSRTLSNYMKKIATSRKWQKWFEYQQSFNWTPKNKTAQSLSSETKSRIRVRSKSNITVTTHKWVTKLSTLPSAFLSCDAGDPNHLLDC